MRLHQRLRYTKEKIQQQTKPSGLCRENTLMFNKLLHKTNVIYSSWFYIIVLTGSNNCISLVDGSIQSHFLADFLSFVNICITFGQKFICRGLFYIIPAQEIEFKCIPLVSTHGKVLKSQKNKILYLSEQDLWELNFPPHIIPMGSEEICHTKICH